MPDRPRSAPCHSTAESTALDDSDHRHVIAELDALLERVAELLQRFAALGQAEAQRADYLALHELQARALAQRQAHWQALETPEAGDLPEPLTGAKVMH